MKIIYTSITVISLLISCSQSSKDNTVSETPLNKEKERVEINNMLDSFNLSAAQANFDAYFNFFTEDAVFIGTDATENWDKKSFMNWAKPFFNKKKTWNFVSLQRNIYFSNCKDLAWFDELLNTQMKICRGSGIVIKQNKRWKVQQYVLSMTIPNSKTDSIVKIKTSVEDSLIRQYQQKR